MLDLKQFIKSTFDEISSYQIIDFIFTQDFFNILLPFIFLLFIVFYIYCKIKNKSFKEKLFEAILNFTFKTLIYMVLILFIISFAKNIKSI